MIPSLRRSLLVFAGTVFVSRFHFTVHDRSKEKWGDFANIDQMNKFIQEQHLDLELVDKQEPVDYSGDVDGRMFILVFKKTKRTARKPIAWLLQRAEDLQAGWKQLLQQPGEAQAPRESGLLQSTGSGAVESRGLLRSGSGLSNAGAVCPPRAGA